MGHECPITKRHVSEPAPKDGYAPENMTLTGCSMLMFSNTKEITNMALTACSMLTFSNTKEITNMTLRACSMLMFSNTEKLQT
jgi:hypothetical protein